jgi:hypothetical protein
MMEASLEKAITAANQQAKDLSKCLRQKGHLVSCTYLEHVVDPSGWTVMHPVHSEKRSTDIELRDRHGDNNHVLRIVITTCVHQAASQAHRQ